jgi:hypothetical protein
MDTTRRSSVRRLRNNGAAAAASIALAVFASAMGTRGAAASPDQASVRDGAVINTVRFFGGVMSPVSVGTLRMDELRQLTAARRGSESEGERPDGPPTLVLEWVELPTRGSDVGTADGWLSLRVINLSPLAHVAAATVIGDAGSPNSRTQSSLVSFNLPAESVQVVGIRAAPAPAASWGFSGAMTVHVRACPTDPAIASRCAAAVSAPAYFHPAGGQSVRFYGAQALVSRYRSGDLLGASIVLPGRGTLRVMGGRPFTTDRASDRSVREER